ncbi:MAG: iron-containing alcohol dehydrogenase, partial [Halobacteriaceae archaeon]
VVASFEEAGYDPSSIVIEEASFEVVKRTRDQAREMEAGLLIGVGGGTPIDVAKMAADEIDVGFVSVPTAASHDGIVSGRSSIPEGDTRHSVAADPP